MSKFADKIISGQIPSEEDWNQYLVEAHGTAPGMTPAAFAPYKTEAGLTSYEILTKKIDGIASPATVLDLACGDGYLFQFLLPTLGPTGSIIGIDMSDDELAIAKKNYGHDKRVKLQNAKAQQLPIADNSIDAIVSHMAFMLMMPVEPVISEIRRVLKTGGSFSAVIGNARGKGGLFGEFLKIAFQFLDKRYSKFKETLSGDPRVKTESGIRDLFSSKQGFQDPIEFFDFSLLVKTDHNGVWNLMKDMYFVSILQDTEKGQLRGELKDFVATQAEKDGTVSFEFPMRMFSVRKR